MKSLTGAFLAMLAGLSARDAQVPVDGAYLRLSHEGRAYHYHHGGRRGLFPCDE